MSIIIVLIIFELFSVVVVSRKVHDRVMLNKQCRIELLILGLLFAQMVMYKAGSDISPFASYQGRLTHISIFGRTLSAWLSMIITLACFGAIMINKHRKDSYDIVLLLGIAYFVCSGMINALIGVGGLTEITKFLLPFLMFLTIKERNKAANGFYLQKLLKYTNEVLLLQVGLSKILTGRFAASTYYLEMKEEYFGFFNHPHNFTGLLGILSIWALYNISQKVDHVEYSLLFVINIVLMYYSGSRSYVYALIGAVGYGLFASFVRTDIKGLRKLSCLGAVSAVLFGKKFITKIGATRVTSAVLSGRAERWICDIQYYLNSMNNYQKIFGGGFNYVSEVNYRIFGYYINSLNIIIDLLIDTGVVGLILYSIMFITVFRFFYKRGNKSFTIIIGLFFLVASCATSLITYQLVTIYMILVLFAMKTKEPLLVLSKSNTQAGV